ncbi:hypothetical protein [Clostridium sp. Marseille-Q2269]|nr:hypothetical protein [Clostridium sp. Marseille-Q2269]
MDISVQITLIICITVVILSLINFIDTRLILCKKATMKQNKEESL